MLYNPDQPGYQECDKKTFTLYRSIRILFREPTRKYFMVEDAHFPSDGPIPIRVDPDLKPLIPGFLENRTNDAVSILQALEKNDFETIKLLGHSMKGSGGGYGFMAISCIGADLEKAAMDCSIPRIESSIKDLQDYLARIQIIYD